MKLFITGISGLLGLNMALQLRDKFTVGGAYHKHPIAMDGVEAMPADMTDLSSVTDAFTHFKPDIIIHTAAIANVDTCESDPEQAQRLNVDATANVAKVAESLGAHLVYISTDHLFDGAEPWRTEDDLPAPLNVYAATKWEGERAAVDHCPSAMVVRTNFFGWGSPIKDSFSDWILKGLRDGQRLTMFGDAFFTPLVINDLVDLLVELIGRRVGGIYNVAGRDRLSKHSFAMQLAQAFGCSTANIEETLLADDPSKVTRPNDMSLASGKLEQLIGAQVPTVAGGLSRLRRMEEESWPQELRRAVENAVPHTPRLPA